MRTITPATLLASQDHFVKFAARAGSGYDARFASKFGLSTPWAGSRLGTGVLPLPAEWPWIAVHRGYRNALLAAQGEAALTAKALARLISALKEPNRLVVISGKLGSDPPQLNDRHVGVILEHKGERVIGVLDAALVQLAGDRQIARSLIKLLGTHGAYAGGQGHAGTSQIGRPLIIKGDAGPEAAVLAVQGEGVGRLGEGDGQSRAISVSCCSVLPQSASGVLLRGAQVERHCLPSRRSRCFDGRPRFPLTVPGYDRRTGRNNFVR